MDTFVDESEREFTVLRRKTDHKWSLPDGWPLIRKVGAVHRPYADRAIKELGIVRSQVPGPISNYEPSRLYERLYKYDGCAPFRPCRKTFAAAVKRVSSRWDFGVEHQELTPQVIQNLKLSKNSGLPALTYKREDFPRGYEESVLITRNLASPPPCVGFSRTQGSEEVDGLNKVRLIWGFPLSMTILESLFAVPLLEELKRRDVKIMSGYRKLQVAAMTAHLKHYPLRVGFDWSAFDSSLPQQVITAAFGIMEDCFTTLPDYWLTVRKYFFTCGILMPYGDLFVGRRKGIPSGSFFTSIVGSLCNQILIEYLLMMDGNASYETYVLGDDSISGLSAKIDINRMKRLALLHFGMTLSVESVSYAGDLKFLGHAWIKDRPYRPIETSFQRLLYSERKSREVFLDAIINQYADNHLLWSALPLWLRDRISSGYVSNDPWVTGWSEDPKSFPTIAAGL